MNDSDGRKRAAGELESQVMSVLWAAGRSMTPAEVQAELVPAPAYNTVQTILIRLVDKNVVRRSRAGRAHSYEPVRSEADAAAAKLHATLDGVGDRQLTLQRFAESLDDAEAQVLRRLLADLEREGR
ncbi:BlaI/MecI/CopY family transcriptional regulator [Catellatospora sp. KI3]|uniref:BlaI/MecI/CopY family transcriptional regulator n=1 Tax=Catellatospora sp. KI3 TaxID=3041620 RepID=UPI0024826983|nr:BlaI/MecI/CopY family transcriptional regulator [Catellatospora sp. KI3]MDI1461351.1 BlaI/MecI/CopY family transcriptional regulator [Catellatospora sp. KI3]